MSTDPPWRWNWEAIGAVGSVGAALAALLAICVAWVQLGDVVAARRAQNYLELRKVFFDVNKELDVVERDASYPDKVDCKPANALRRYWYFVQTEWTLSSLDAFEQDNWKKVQLPLTLFALKYPAFRKTFLDLQQRVFTAGRGPEFVAEVSNAYKEHYQKSIDADYQKLKESELSCKPS